MVYVALLMLVAALEMLSAILIFWFKDVLHTVLALSFVFIFNSALFLMLSQPLLALIQLFVMVGGVATYAFVAVASESFSRFKHTNYIVLAIGYVAIFSIITYEMLSGNLVQQPGSVADPQIPQAINTNAGILYLIGLLMFGTGFGSILLMKKLGGKN